MDLLIGIGLLIYFTGLIIYKYIFGGDFLEARTVLQLTTSGIGSVIILLPIILNKIKNIDLSNIPNTIPKKEKKMDLPKCDEKVIMDTECLHYLKHRAAEIGSNEAIQMIVKLNSILFADTCREEKEDE